MAKEKGFTLIELSIVLIISGLALAGAIEAYKIYSEKQNIENTKSLLADLDQSLKNFPNIIDPNTADPVTGLGGNVYARLPCPDIDSDGREDCGMATIRGRRFDGSPNGPQVMVGGLPYTTLGLAMDYATDPYRQPVIYAITQSATQAATYGSGIGAIKITDDGGNESFTNQYTIVATGRMGCDGDGADIENCDGDADFIAAFHTETANDYYDDRVTYHAQLPTLIGSGDQNSCAIQTKAFVSYSGSCPSGWNVNSDIDLAEMHLLHRDGSISRTIISDGSVIQAFPDESGSIAPKWGISVNNIGEAGSTGRYYNLDPQSGGYYFTDLKGSETVFDAMYSPSHPISDPSMIRNAVVCDKASDNEAPHTCYNNRLGTNISAAEAQSVQSSATPLDELKKYCPGDYKPMGMSGNPGALHSVSCGK